MTEIGNYAGIKSKIKKKRIQRIIMDKLGERGKRVNTTKNWTRYWDIVQHLHHQFYLTPGPPATAADASTRVEEQIEINGNSRHTTYK